MAGYLTGSARPVMGAADLTELRGFDPAEFASLGIAYLATTSELFYWDPTSVSADDGVTVIRPTSIDPGDPGRWLTTGIAPAGPGGGAYFKDPVADFVALRAVVGYSDGDVRLVRDTFGGDEMMPYAFNSSFGAGVADNGATLGTAIKPDDILVGAAGRWEPVVGPRQNLYLASARVTYVDGISAALGVGTQSGTTGLNLGQAGFVTNVANALSVGTSFATAGTIRLPNLGTVQGKGAGAYNLTALTFGATDILSFGDDTNTAGIELRTKTATNVDMFANNVQAFNFDMAAARVLQSTSSTSFTVTMKKTAGTGAAASLPVYIAGQIGKDVAAGTNNTGGELYLLGGSKGTGGAAGADGNTYFGHGSTAGPTIAATVYGAPSGGTPTMAVFGSLAVQTGGSPLSATGVAQSGVLRLSNAGIVKAINAAGSVDFPMMQVTASNILQFGDKTVGATAETTAVQAANKVSIDPTGRTTGSVDILTGVDGNIILHATAVAAANDGKRVLSVGDATLVPTGNPVAGFFVYGSGGPVYIRRSDALVVQIA